MTNQEIANEIQAQNHENLILDLDGACAMYPELPLEDAQEVVKLHNTTLITEENFTFLPGQELAVVESESGFFIGYIETGEQEGNTTFSDRDEAEAHYLKHIAGV